MESVPTESLWQYIVYVTGCVHNQSRHPKRPKYAGLNQHWRETLAQCFVKKHKIAHKIAKASPNEIAGDLLPQSQGSAR